MANLTLIGGEEFLEWEITGLSNWFATNQYISAGITNKPFDDRATSISGIVDAVSATDDGTSFSVSGYIGHVSGTFTFYGFAQGSDGRYWNAGSGTVVIKPVEPEEPEEPEIERPRNWSWTSTIKSGSEVNITALEWNSFTSRINAFREYDGLGDYDFTYVYSGITPISASICNEARSAINQIYGHGTLPSKAEPNNPLTASFFNGLMNALNSVP